MRRMFFVALLVVFRATGLNAQGTIVAKFEARSHSFQGTTLPYRFFIPENYDSTKKYPLVLALHGAGERGSDNVSHVASYRIATAWADPVNQSNFPCFVCAPQCPEGRSWTYGFYPAPMGEEMATVVDILDSLAVEFSIDENRFYVTGLSMGGFGTWDLITRFPDRFAAAIPMSAGGNPSLVDRIHHVSIWNFHGALDDAVPVSDSRIMMDALEQTGRSVLYTHCRVVDCRGVPDSVIAMHVESHTDLFYTEYEDGGHIIWDESYDFPYLIPWVFDQYTRTPDAIQLINMEEHRTLQGVEPLQWTSINTEGNVDIWYSPDAGNHWQPVSVSEPNSGLYDWNTEAFEDCAFGLLKIFLKNSRGFIYGTDCSHYFTIDNEVNGRPFVKIVNEEFWRGEILDQDIFDLQFLIGDAETDPLEVRLLFSADNGRLFNQFDSFITDTDTIPHKRSITLTHLSNSTKAIIRVHVSDGMSDSFDETNTFVKETPRLSGPEVNHVAGSSGAAVTVNIVDQGQLTGDLYRITFNDTLYDHKVYDVLDVDVGAKVVEGASQMDGGAEGPLFDGVRLVIEDFDPPVVDVENTGWIMGASNIEVTVYIPTVNLGTEVLQGVPSPSDYRILFYDRVVDTSSSAFGAIETPMMFSVWNLTEDRPVDVIFLDNDKNHTVSRLDELFLLLMNNEEPQLTWAVFFGGQPSALNPQPGDMFDLVTRKPIRSDDIYEFRAVTTSPRKGDINNDHVVDLFDVLKAVNIVLHTVEPSEEEFWAADCNDFQGVCDGDNTIDVLDVVKIIRISLGIDTCN